MPEFILDHGSREASSKLASQDAFTQGYIEAMFFTETGTGDDEDLEDATLADLSEEAWARVDRDCKAFQAAAGELLALAYDQPGYDAEAAGRDFWFTRNGHGVGFWDRKPLDVDAPNGQQLGKALSALCGYGTPFRGCDLCFGADNKIHLE